MANIKKEAVIALIPAIHTGYIKFFRKHKGKELFIMGTDFLKEFPRLERDMRRGKDQDMKDMITSLKVFKKITILDRKNIKTIFPEKDAPKWKIVMPEDDVLEKLAEKYLSTYAIKYENVFLRWSWKNATHIKTKISTLGTTTSDAFAKNVLKDLYKQVKKSSDWWRQISSALVVDGKVLKMTHNHPLPSDYVFDMYGDPRSNFDAGEHPDKYLTIHSETAMIAWAAREGISLKDATIFVTTFPCSNCSRLIAESGIKTIYFKEGYSMLDAEKIIENYDIKVFRVED